MSFVNNDTFCILNTQAAIVIDTPTVIYVFAQPTYDMNHKPRRSGDKYGFSPPQSPLTSGPPDLPPRIDRASKPPRTSAPRSAQERLFGSRENQDPPNYINATPHAHHRPANSSLERHNPTKTVRTCFILEHSYFF